MPAASALGYENSGAFYRDVETLLRQQIRQSPHRLDLRYFLLEVYCETGRLGDFAREAEALRARLADPDHSVEWKRVLELGCHMKSVTEKTTPTPSFSGHGRLGEDASYEPYFNKLGQEYESLAGETRFLTDFDLALVRYSGRPTSLFHAARLSRHYGGAQLYFKREDLAPPHTHLTIAVMGQALTAQKLGRKTLVGYSQKGYGGVMMASVAAHLGLGAVIYMHTEDIKQQSDNVFRMRLMGASIETVKTTEIESADLRKVALDHCVAQPDSCFLVVGLDAIPHPYPMMARDFMAVIGRETLRQVRAHAKLSPSVVVARGGDNADALGLLPPYLSLPEVRLVCVEGGISIAGNAGPDGTVFDRDMQKLSLEQIRAAGVILERLEYPSVAREQAWLRGTGRVEYPVVAPPQARRAIFQMSRLEGITPAIRTAHAVAWAGECAAKLPASAAVVVLLAENADKDIWEIAAELPQGPDPAA